MNTKLHKTPAYAGVDISKDRLDVSLEGKAPCHYANSASGIGQLIKVLAALSEPVQVICEPSGGYERALLAGLWEAKIAVSLVNAARVRAFARAQGLLAKTDQIDAAVLREFGELLQPEALEAPSPQRERLAALVQRREQLVSILLMEEQRLTQTHDKVVRRLGEKLVQELEEQVKQLEELIEKQIDDDDTLKKQSERMQQVKVKWTPSVGQLERVC